jgi:hypothetical protein
VTAAQLARAYDRYLFAHWRGEDAPAFAAWLAGHWGPADRPEPATPPTAFSRLGAGGRGIRWHEAGATVVGYIPGLARACYRVPRTAAPPRPEAGR